MAAASDFWLQLLLVLLFTLQSVYTFYKAQSNNAAAASLRRVISEERSQARTYERTMSEALMAAKESLNDPRWSSKDTGGRQQDAGAEASFTASTTTSNDSVHRGVPMPAPQSASQ